MTNNQQENTKKAYRTLTKIPLFVYILLGILLLSVAVYIVALLSPGFADFYNRYPGAFVRGVLSYITVFSPLSLAELMIILIPLIIFLIARAAYKGYCANLKSAMIFTLSLLSCISLFFSIFVLGFGCGYHGHTRDVKMGLDKKPVAPEELEATAAWLAGEVNSCADEI